MKIAYITNARMPTEKAHGLQIMQMCQAFARNSHDVTLIVPDRKNAIDQDLWTYYGITPSFRIVKVPALDLIRYDRWLGHWAFRLLALLFALRCRRAVEELGPDLIYSRDPFSSVLMPGWIPLAFEAHTLPKSQLWFHRWLWRTSRRVVVMTDGLKRRLVELGTDAGKLVVAHDAVDLDRFRVSATRADVRSKLGLPQDGFLAVYAGHLYSYTGIDDMLDAAKRLTLGVRLAVVGGRDEDIARVRARVADEKIGNVVIVGRVPHTDVPKWLRAADVAVMAYRDDGRHVAHFASPLKLFEYLAAGRAIVTTDLPSIREVLHDGDAVYIRPGDGAALADALNALAKDPTRIAALETKSNALAPRYTWKSRAETVIADLASGKEAWKPSFWRKHRMEFTLAGLAFVLRLMYVMLFPQHPLIGGDGPFYLALADNIRGVYKGDTLPLYYQPLYPLLLAAVRTIFGEALIWARIMQAALSAATVFVLMLIARRWATPYAAWIAGLFGALYVPAILESGIFYTETTYTFLLTLSVLAVLTAMESKKGRSALLAGATLSLTLFTRDLALYLAPILGVAAGILKKSWKLAALIIIPVLLTVGASALHNRSIAGSTPANYVPLVAKRFDQAALESDFQKFAFLTPSRWVMYPIGAFVYFRYPFRLLDLSTGVPVKQALLSGNWPQISSALPEVATKGFLVMFHWFILAMAVLGILKGKVSRQAKIIMVIVILYAMVTIVVRSVGHVRGFDAFEPLARYRFPTEPLILILAAAGIERLTRSRERTKEL